MCDSWQKWETNSHKVTQSATHFENKYEYKIFKHKNENAKHETPVRARGNLVQRVQVPALTADSWEGQAIRAHIQASVHLAMLQNEAIELVHEFSTKGDSA